MKRICAIGLLLLLFLCSCDVGGSAVYAEGDTTGKDGSDAAGEISALTAYYQERLLQMEQTLLAQRVSFSEERADYLAHIAALSEALCDVGLLLEGALLYRVSDGGATVCGYVGRESAVTIPAQLGGAPVVAIADRAFENALCVTEVTVSDGVRSIGWLAFSGCVSLERITLPTSVTSIEYGAFLNCPAAMRVCAATGSYAAAYAESYGFSVVPD